MLHQLTQYLFQYHAVNIPSVGTIHLVHHAPELKVAEKILQPPHYSASIKMGDVVTDHQLQYLAHFFNDGSNELKNRLQKFGEQVRRAMQNGGFQWQGVGLLYEGQQEVVITSSLLPGITAERVIRTDAPHQVLIGDHQTNSFEIADKKLDASKEKISSSLPVRIGWLVLLLSILFILFLLFKGKFRIGVTGSKQTIAYSASAFSVPKLV